MKTFLLALVLSITSPLVFAEKIETAVFAGGCFWCMQPPYDKLKSKGVVDTQVGYAGGHTENPTYKDVSAGDTGHLEVIQIKYDSEKISYEKLLEVFWRNIDPYDNKGQFCDKGSSYLSAVFYNHPDQKRAYEKSLKKLKDSGKINAEVATKLLPLKKFYPAEDYHQSYYKKNPLRYKYYRFRCGRDRRLEDVWGK